jgi:transposase
VSSSESPLSLATGERVVRRRTHRDPRPRFKADRSNQLDVVHGSPALSVSEDHLAKQVAAIVLEFDTSSIEANYSSLGRHGYHPRSMLAVWLYASLTGVHHATKVAHAIKTDAAFRLLSGGHAVSAPTLRRFRQHNQAFFLSAVERTVEIARERGLLKLDELAVDSLRVRAHASSKASRTLNRSRTRLAELLAAVTDKMTPSERERHEAKVAKHRDAVERCLAEGRTNIVVTNPAAGLLKFPNGASGPGHRVTVAAAGVQERLVLSVLVDADGTDYGKAGPALRKVRDLLERFGAFGGTHLRATADAGYWSEDDLKFADENDDWVELLVAERSSASEEERPDGFFSRERFNIDENGNATCPAGRLMNGPWSDGKVRIKYAGVGCATCQLKAKCTSGKQRALYVRPTFEKARSKMRARMAEPGAQTRYNKRIATVEPVFANIEDAMGFRRCSSRHEQTVMAEIMLKILAHNVGRLLTARRLARVQVTVNEF